MRIRDIKPNAPKRGAFRIAKLKHAGDWNIAPRAIPNLMDALRKPPFGFNVVLTQKELFPRDPNLIYYPLIYLQGRAAFVPQRRPGGPASTPRAGRRDTLCRRSCGNDAFDASFRRFVAELLPAQPLVPIPREDQLFTRMVGADLSNVQFNKAAGGGRGFPQLEGVKIGDHWGIIYSKYDIGRILEHHTGLECKGYTYESALRIAGNIVIYSTLP